ncbi:hypothetical protein ACH5RR_010676 [Cinchona calisaya]|uniref:BHLH domain-containing protein n=1 Tax=Cinchona calisaya TaxID=153742 RepID=A0ABD3AJL8_9GENT
MGATEPTNSQLQNMLQMAVQTVQWTYSLFWQLCPQKRILIWSDGYYNGAIKTRKTVQPTEVTAEEASLQRSQELRELYDALSGAGETNQKQQARRPAAALSPEDLTESEWFYLMCVSFSFPPGAGLPGRAYAKRQHVWLTGANEVDSKLFSRAILAKSAHIQTVVCIPLLDGVVELGTVERVQEDLGFVQNIKSIFGEHQQPQLQPPKPALSEHSTSDPATSSSLRFQENTNLIEEEEDAHDEDDEEEEEEEEDEAEADSDIEADTIRSNNNNNNSPSRSGVVPNPNTTMLQNPEAEPSELMQLDLSEDIRLGSPDDGSNNMESDYHMLPTTQMGNQEIQQIRGVDLCRSSSEPIHRWPRIVNNPTGINSLEPPPSSSGVPPLDEFAQEDTHYSQTVSTILHNQSTRWSDTSSNLSGTHSAFSKWSAMVTNQGSGQVHLGVSSQWTLKYILFTVPFLHSKSREETSPKSDTVSRLRKGTPQEELISANHVLAERRRREKLNERFIILRSLVPFVTKMDKASILGDTIEYVKQLRKKIQELEADQRSKIVEDRPKKSTTMKEQRCGVKVGHRLMDKRKMRIVDQGSDSGGKAKGGVQSPPQGVEEGMFQVEVSIIESDALVELQCPHREGLLLDIMQMLRNLRIETTAVQSSLNNGIFVAELRAKVKENANGKKATIMEVKKAIHQIIPQ